MWCETCGMGLFQKKPISESANLYKIGIGQNKTLLIVGLGNPGSEFKNTRHNIGFEIVDNLAKKLDFPTWSLKKDLKCQLTQHTVGDSKVILVKPITFMNLSGEAVQVIAKFYKIPDNQIIAVHDELDIPFGQIRTRVGGSSAGHNGVKSLIQHLGDNFGRIRVGVQNYQSAKQPSEKFVLDKFSPAEQKELSNLLQEANSILSEYIYSGDLPAETRSFIF